MKPFFDVFPKLKVRPDLRDYFKETQVEKLTTNHAHTRVKVRLHSGHLIHKGRIYRMEDEIAKQVFPEKKVEVYIDEHYSLSSQYTPRRLMEEYRDSLSREIENFSHVMGKFFREAQVTFVDERSIRITMEESFLSRSLSGKLEEALNRIFRERCGVDADLTVALREEEGTERKAVPKRRKPLRGVDADFAVHGMPFAAPQSADAGRIRKGSRDEGRFHDLHGAIGQNAAPVEEQKQEEGRGIPFIPGRKPSGGRRQNGGKRPYTLKRSSNPDVIFGREVTEEAMPVCDIVDEIGEVEIEELGEIEDLGEIRSESEPKDE